LAEHEIDLIVMARYMQVLSRPFCERNSTRTLNIHHSFLPAFEGARPYHRAHERGVKIIGATAHYATADLGARRRRLARLARLSVRTLQTRGRSWSRT